MPAGIIGLLKSLGFKGRTIDMVDGEYDRARRVWNGTADRRPLAVAYALDPDDVRRAVEGVATSGVPLAVRSGGHSLPGLSTCDGGLILDLSSLNKVVADFGSRIANVAGGALLGDLDRTTVPHGYVVPAGVVSHTGVAGLTLGGGMGRVSRKLGLTIDSMVSAELVTADGSLVQVDAASDPELFWGLRGGGGNFGVVTAFTFNLHELRSAVAGLWNYPLEKAGAVLAALGELAPAQPRECSVAFTLSGSGLNLTAVWIGTGKLAEAILRPFGQLTDGGSGGISDISFLGLQSRNDDHFAWSRRYYAKGGFLKTISDAVIAEMLAAIDSAPTPDSEIYVQQLGGAVADVDEDATAYTGRGADYYWIVEPVWDRASDDHRCLAWGRLHAGRLAAHSMKGNYVNEQADAGVDVARQAYGETKYARLRRLKTRLDPGNLFRLNQNIEPYANGAVD